MTVGVLLRWKEPNVIWTLLSAGSVHTLLYDLRKPKRPMPFCKRIDLQRCFAVYPSSRGSWRQSQNWTYIYLMPPYQGSKSEICDALVEPLGAMLGVSMLWLLFFLNSLNLRLNSHPVCPPKHGSGPTCCEDCATSIFFFKFPLHYSWVSQGWLILWCPTALYGTCGCISSLQWDF